MKVTLGSTGVLAAAAVLGGLALFIYVKKNGVRQVVGGVVHAGVEVADTVVSETVFSVGEIVGIPRTNETECERAKREGRTWDASFACPAGDFLSYLWS